MSVVCVVVSLSKQQACAFVLAQKVSSKGGVFLDQRREHKLSSCLLGPPMDGGADLSDDGSLPDELPLSEPGQLSGNDLLGELGEAHADPTPTHPDGQQEQPQDTSEATPSKSGGCGAWGTGTDHLSAIRLVTPKAPSGGKRGRGRGRGRPSKRITLVPKPEHSEALVSATSSSAVANANASVVSSGGAARSDTTAIVWLGKDISVAEAIELAKSCPRSAPSVTILGGFTQRSSSGPALSGAVVAGQLTNVVDRDVDRLASVLLRHGGGQGSILSLTALSAVAQVERRKCAVQATRFAAFLTGLCRERLALLEQTVEAMVPREGMVLYVEAVQYDETPMPTVVTGDTSQQAASKAAAFKPAQQRLALALADSGGSQGGQGAICRMGSTKALTVRASQSKHKVMQTRQDVGMLLRSGPTLFAVTFRLPSALAVVESTTAAVIQRQQQAISPIGRVSRCFQLSTRAATTDAYAANILAEKGICRERDPDQPGLHLLCNVHATAGVYNKTFALVDGHITGVIRTALACRSGSAMSRLRHCLREEIASRFDVIVGRPAADSIKYKKAILRLFVRHGAGVATRATLLALCPTGDWRSRRVQYYVHAGGPAFPDATSVLEHVTNGVVVALTSAQPHMYNRSKWTGSDLAVDDLGVFEAVHRLLSTTFCRFSASFVKGSLRSQMLVLGATLREYGKAESQAMEGGDDDDEAEGDADADPAGGINLPVAESCAVEPGANPDQRSGPASVDTSWAKQNAKDRRMALDFLRKGTLGHLVLMRVIMEPMRQFLNAQFELASEDWAVRQRCMAAKACNEGRPVEPKYRIVEMLQGPISARFSTQLHLLWSAPELWEPMPPTMHTVEHRALGFRLASRMGCAFHRLLSSRHAEMPYQMFTLLAANPALAAPKLAAWPKCRLDAWPSKFLDKFPTLQERDVLPALGLIATLLPVDISHVESLHASLRRMLTARSVQTHRLGLSELSAMWVCQQFRTWHKKRHSGVVPRKPGGAKKQSGPGKQVIKRFRAKTSEHTPDQRPGAGGAWRAWVRKLGSKSAVSGKLVQSLATKYREAKAAGTTEFLDAKRAGVLATEAHRRNPGIGRGKAFGGSTVASMRPRKALMAHWLSLVKQNQQQRDPAAALVWVQKSLESGATVAQSLSMGRVANRELATQIRQEKEMLLGELEKFQQHAGMEAMNQLKATQPGLGKFPMQAEPCAGGGVHVQVCMPDSSEVRRAVSWANENYKASPLGIELDKHWASDAEMLMAEACPEVPEPPPEQQQGPCLGFGICLCCEGGQKLRKRADKFVGFLKLVCPAGSKEREDLVEGKLVFRLMGSMLDYEAMLAEDKDGGFKELWLHVGLHYLSPFDPTFMLVEPTPDPGEVPADRRRVYVRSREIFQSLYVGLAPLQQCDLIEAKCYKVESAGRPIATYMLHPLPIVAMDGFEEWFRFWPRVRRRRPVGAMPANDNGSDAENSAEEGDPHNDHQPEEDVLPAAESGPEVSGETLELLAPLMDAYDAASACPVEGANSAASGIGGAEIQQESEADPQNPPPDPPGIRAAPERKHARGRRARAGEVAIVVQGGIISYYASNGNFEARCLVHDDERCTMTRRGMNAAKRYRGKVGGKPLGMLTAWLACGAMCENKEQHHNKGTANRLSGPEELEFRKMCRRSLADIDGGLALLEHERANDEGEESEPEKIA